VIGVPVLEAACYMVDGCCGDRGCDGGVGAMIAGRVSGEEAFSFNWLGGIPQ
jgi:hypothetical protein